ncbi:hypothetical protein RHMOL_Rhmol11G0054500 [Rhododendron molle]|uniref:Uncharacterized protein n=1 Tax=Rhododendron molle TaxID=49168 RepID=A0ACC0LNM2_RHOML|nr:hypothetical protein RHMOL_Rhmol11G0054500 [Rhododendron molle]
MPEGFINFSSILQAEESTVEEERSMRWSSIIKASPDKGQSSSVKPSSPHAPSSWGLRRVPAFSASNIPSTIMNEELAVLRVRYSIPSSVSLGKPSGSERAYTFIENEACLYVGALEGGAIDRWLVEGKGEKILWGEGRSKRYGRNKGSMFLLFSARVIPGLLWT